MVHWQDFVDAMSLLLSLSLVVLEPVWSTVLFVVLSPRPSQRTWTPQVRDRGCTRALSLAGAR